MWSRPSLHSDKRSTPAVCSTWAQWNATWRAGRGWVTSVWSTETRQPLAGVRRSSDRRIVSTPCSVTTNRAGSHLRAASAKQVTPRARAGAGLAPARTGTDTVPQSAGVPPPATAGGEADDVDPEEAETLGLPGGDPVVPPLDETGGAVTEHAANDTPTATKTTERTAEGPGMGTHPSKPHAGRDALDGPLSRVLARHPDPVPRSQALPPGSASQGGRALRCLSAVERGSHACGSAGLHRKAPGLTGPPGRGCFTSVWEGAPGCAQGLEAGSVRGWDTNDHGPTTREVGVARPATGQRCPSGPTRSTRTLTW